MKNTDNQNKNLFKQASECILFIRDDMTIIDARGKGNILLGYTKEELISLKLNDLLFSDEISHLSPTLEALKKGRIIKDYWKIRRKDQSAFIGEVSGKKLTDETLQIIIGEENNSSRNGIDEQHNERFRLTLDHLLEGCQIIGFDWRYLYINNAAEIQNHRPSTELLGKCYMDVWPGIEKTEVFSYIKLTLEKRISVHFENEFIYPDGSHGWFDLSIQPVPEGVFILSIDITERKKIENYLKENEAKYRLVLDNTSEWIYWLTPEKKVNYVSPAFEEMTGYTVHEFIANPHLTIEICHTDDKEHVADHFNSVFTTNDSCFFEFRITTKSGETRWFTHFCNPLFGANGEFLGRRAVNRNITDLKLKEKQLRESEHRFSKIYEKGSFGMAIIGADLKYKSVNPTFIDMMGYSEEELQNLTFIDVTFSEDKTKDMEDVKRLINNEIQVLKTEKRFIRKNGDVFWASLTVTANFNDEGTHLYNLALVEDINERKKYKDSIEKQNALLNAILNSSSEVIIFALDKNFRYLAFNENHRLEMKRAWNVEIGIGYDLLSLMPNERLREKTRKNIERTWDGDSFTEIHHQLQPQIFHEYGWSPIYQDGEITGTTIIIRDITEEKKAEMALRESEEKFRKFFEINPDSISISRLSDGIYMSVNNGFSQLFGYTNEEVVGKNSIDINLWHDFQDRNRYVNELKLLGFIENFETKFIRKDANLINALVSAILLEVNNVQCILCTVKDITDLKNSQEALTISQNLLNEVGRIAHIGGWEFIPDTGKSSWTREVALIHGLDSQSPASVEQSLSFYSEQSRPVIINALKEIIEYGVPYDLELEFIDASHELKWIRTMGQPVFKDGKLQKVYGTFQDITEKKLAEQELINAKENAEAVSRLKTAFINNISHEIRTPLNGIMGFAQIITDPYYPLEERALYSQWMNESCDRLMTTITNIMDLSLLTSGNMKVRKYNVMISDVLEKAGEGFTFMCRLRDLVINIETKYLAEHECIITDEEKLSRILFQLVDNAVKFSQNGTITIGAVKKDQEFHFYVKDTGIGISDEYKSQIYDYFTQIDNSLSRKYEGTGIGLSIAKGFVNLLGGNIWVESKKDKGSSFHFSIPVGD